MNKNLFWRMLFNILQIRYILRFLEIRQRILLKNENTAQFFTDSSAFVSKKLPRFSPIPLHFFRKNRPKFSPISLHFFRKNGPIFTDFSAFFSGKRLNFSPISLHIFRKKMPNVSPIFLNIFFEKNCQIFYRFLFVFSRQQCRA